MIALRAILNETRLELMRKDRLREIAYKDLRKATSLSKQAILLTHQERLKEAKGLIGKARKNISKVKSALTAHPSVMYSGMYTAALQEYSEANIFLDLVRKSRFITPKEIDVPSEDYVLGLADVIGECRRSVLDALREGDAKKGEEYLRIMDQIYVELMAMDESYMLVPGLRRKCDVARKIIEITRGDVTQEVRREELEKQMRRFEQHTRKMCLNRTVR